MSTSNDEGSRRPSGRAGALATLVRGRPRRARAADGHMTPEQSRLGRAVAVAELAASLQRYTVVAGAPGSSTTELLAQLAGALRAGDPARRVVFVDPKGDGRFMLSRHTDISNPGVTVHVGPDASLDRIAHVIGAVPGGCDVLIDNARSRHHPREIQRLVFVATRQRRGHSQSRKKWSSRRCLRSSMASSSAARAGRRSMSRIISASASCAASIRMSMHRRATSSFGVVM